MLKLKSCNHFSELGIELEELRNAGYFTSLFRESYEAIYCPGIKFRNLIITENNLPVGIILMSELNQELGFIDRGVEFLFLNTVSESQKLEVYYLFQEYLNQNFKNYKIRLTTGPEINKTFDLNLEHVSQQLEAYIDLNLNIEMIRKGIRKSYKSLINWGEKNLKTTIYDRGNLNDKDCEKFRQFHILVSGKETRSIDSWNMQFDLIKQGDGFLVMSELEGKLVSANMILSGKRDCLYAVGVNDRELMEKNISIGHYPIYAAILKAKELGHKKFHFGTIWAPNFNDKNLDIGKFKKGFASSVEFTLINNYKIS